MKYPAVDLNELYIPKMNHQDDGQVVVAIALVKNEADIITLWLAHLTELFDYLYIVDHNSIDGTREFLLQVAEKKDNIYLFSFEHPGYFQEEITNKLAEMVCENHQNAWIFPMDADEFINIENRDNFLCLLRQQKNKYVLKLDWENCLPVAVLEDAVLRYGFPLLRSNNLNSYNKIAIHSAYLKEHCLRFIQGNHGMKDPDGNVTYAKKKLLDIYHIPVRSLDHFVLKCVQGYIAYKELAKERNCEGQGVHWADMIDTVLVRGEISHDLLRKYVYSYGENNELDGASVYRLIDHGWQVQAFNIPAAKSVMSQHFERKMVFAGLARMLMDRQDMYLELRKFIRVVDDHRMNMDNFLP